MHVLLGRAVTEYRRGGSRNILFMRFKLLVLTVKNFLQSVHICGSYRKIKTGVPFFGPPGRSIVCSGLASYSLRGTSDDSIYRNIDISFSIWIYRIVSYRRKRYRVFRYIAIFKKYRDIVARPVVCRST